MEMTKIEDEYYEVCYLCKKKSSFEEIVNIDLSDVEENEEDLILCSDCCGSGKCEICDKYFVNREEIFYLIDNYNNIDKCIICLLEQTKKENKEKYKKEILNEILDEVGLKDISELKEIIEFYKKYKKDFLEYININNINESSLPNANKVDSNINIDNIIKEALDKQKVYFEKKLEEQDFEYNTLYSNFNMLKEEKVNKSDVSITSSNSNKIKKDKKNNNKDIEENKDSKILLPDNLEEIVYYRQLKNDKTKENIVKDMTRNGVLYLTCCGESYKNLLLDHHKYKTCTKCYVSYKLDNNNKLLNNILEEHIIENEKEILLKIKCNICNFINKKEIDICYSCKRMKESNIIIFNVPSKREIGYNTKLLVAEETYIKLNYNFSIYKKAEEDGIDTINMKQLIEYIKDNKLMEEKQYNIIKNKILRSTSIYRLYNNDKYINILNFIKRINFSIKAVSKLNDYQWQTFRLNIEKILDQEIERINENDDENKFKFSCKNKSCSDNVDMEDVFCSDCKKDLISCEKCFEGDCDIDDEDD